MREQRLREIRERTKRDAEVWPMGSAEASFAGRFDTWQAMHCTEAVQCYQDREELLRIVDELEAAYRKRELEIDEMINEACWEQAMGEDL